MDLDKKLIGSRFAEARKRKGYTTQYVEELLGISNSYVSMIENSKSIPSVGLLLRFSEIYNVSPNFLLGYDLDWVDQMEPHIKEYVSRQDVTEFVELARFIQESGFSAIAVRQSLTPLLLDVMKRHELRENLTKKLEI